MKDGMAAHETRLSLKVLLVQRDVGERALLAATLRGEGYAVVEIEDIVELSGYLGDGLHASDRRDLPGLLIADANLAGEPGFEILDHLRQSHQRIPVILLSDAPDSELQREGGHLGAAYVLSKPCELADLLVAVWSLVDPEGSGRSRSVRRHRQTRQRAAKSTSGEDLLPSRLADHRHRGVLDLALS
jgi:DNA-binding response OmpR family regulator